MYMAFFAQFSKFLVYLMGNNFAKRIEGRKIELELAAGDANVNILSRASWRRGF